MNYGTAIVVIGWQTRSKKRHAKALKWSKNYGLVPLLANVSIGQLYAKEERELVRSFKFGFTHKTDQFFLTRLCQSCYTGITLDSAVKQKLLPSPHFELIQMPVIGTSISATKNFRLRRNPRKVNKHRLLHKHVA